MWLQCHGGLEPDSYLGDLSIDDDSYRNCTSYLELHLDSIHAQDFILEMKARNHK